MKATNIEWDFDNIDTNETPMDGFPKEIEIPSNIDENNVKTWLLNTFGYHARNFCLEEENEEKDLEER